MSTAESNTRGSKRLRDKTQDEAPPPPAKKQSKPKEIEPEEDERWKVHQLAEDYIEMASNIVLSPTSELGTYGYNLEQNQYPMECFDALGFLQSPLRRPLVIERWSPYEIGLFEAAMAHYGKEFHKVQAVVKTKTTQEVVEFYYIWKKTSHYPRWKESYGDDQEDTPPVE